MSNVLSGLAPNRFFKYFEEISAIPRMSLHEEKIADYVESFAKERGLFCVRDAANNVFAVKEATKGRENDPAVLLQGHTDMVCEKNAGVDHDFLTEGLKLYIDGDFIKAEGTTLGADNGVAVAMMLAALDGEYTTHPRIECLFTSGEEIGLVGAGAFDYSLISARRMINLDSAEEGFVTVGCAGGVRSSVEFCGEADGVADKCISISVKGLIGGHSGEDINKNRHNANAVLFRILRSLSFKFGVKLASAVGGGKDNAIAREASAVISAENTEEVKAEAVRLAECIRAELAPCDSGYNVTVSDASSAKTFSEDLSKRIIGCASGVRTGIIKMSAQIDGLVEFSRNLGIVSVSAEDGHAELIWSTRSPIEAQLDSGEEEISLTAALAGAANVKHYNRYPGWSYPGSSDVCDLFCEAFGKVLGRDASRLILHAGLECGLVKNAIPDMDIISVGPDEIDIHSPDERLGIGSTQRLCEIIRIMIEE